MVRYNLQALGPLWERMASTLYSSSLSMMSGDGFRKDHAFLWSDKKIEGMHGKHCVFSRYWEVGVGK